MHARAQEFAERAREADLDPDVQELPEGTRTAADAAAAIGCDLAQIVKSMAMSVDDDLVLVLTSGVNRIDEAALEPALGADEVGPADPGTVKDRLGFSIGGVPPFAHDEPVPTYLDPTLLDREAVWAGAGTPKTVFPIDPDHLQELSDATVIDAFEDA